jgi:hypothetical protein
VSKKVTKPNGNALRGADPRSAFDLIEFIEQSFMQITPLGATTISWAELEASFARAGKLLDFEQRAKDLFREIDAELGINRAKYIFRALGSVSGTPGSKRRAREFNNVLLLTIYLEHRLPLQQFARRLADGNEDSHGPFGLRPRNGTSDAIEQQLKRLLKKDPAKEESILMRMLLAEARRVHEELGVKPGRPRLNK